MNAMKTGHFFGGAIVSLLFLFLLSTGSLAQSSCLTNLDSPKQIVEAGGEIVELPKYTDFDLKLIESENLIIDFNVAFYGKLFGKWTLESGDIIIVETCVNSEDFISTLNLLTDYEGECGALEEFTDFWVHEGDCFKLAGKVISSGVFYLYLVAADSRGKGHFESIEYTVSRYGRINKLAFDVPDFVVFGESDGEEVLLNKLLTIGVEAEDAYGNKLPICNIKSCQWELDLESGTAKFHPILYPFFKNGALDEGHEFTLNDAVQVETEASVNKTLRLWAGNNDETPSSLSSPEANSTAPEYLDLSGRPVSIGDSPTTPGVYIERRGSETRKVVAR